MLFTPTHIAEQIALLLAIALAAGLGIRYLNWRDHLASLRAIWLPLLGFVVFGVCDALVTLQGTWQAPWREGNPSMRAFLLWAGWWGQCLGSALWILAWALALDGMETLRARISPRGAGLLGALRLWVVYALALGHLNGLVSWTRSPRAIAAIFAWFYAAWRERAAWLGMLSPLGYPLYSGLFFGGLCALAHMLIIWAYDRRRSSAAHAR
jgi:hypothetical protein